MVCHWVMIIALIVLVEIILWLYIEDFLKMRIHSRQKMRLRAYANLVSSEKYCDAVNPEEDKRVLTSAEHLILLGILKKVEAKNATLIAILIFIQAAFLSVYFQPGRWETDGIIMALAAFSLAPALFSSIYGIRHLDIGHLRNFLEKPEGDLEVKLQFDLICDLALKESCFKFSWYVTFITLGVLIPVLFLRLLNYS